MKPVDTGGSVAQPPAVEREEVIEEYRRSVNKGQARLAELMSLPVEATSHGSHIFDETGERYLDCGGYGVFILGHCHPTVVRAVREQLERDPLPNRVLLNPALAHAAEKLVAIAPEGLDYALFANSGAEATEAAIKLAALAGKTHLVATHCGFHGKTLAALSVTGRSAFREPFEDLLPDTCFVPFGDSDALREELARAEGESVFIVEPVQAEGGVVIPPEGYLREAEQACREHDAFFVLDEIQTGMGRLGTWWGADREGVRPDIMLVGKGLSGGVVPVSATLATRDAFERLNRDPMLHTSTYAGSPLATAAAAAAIDAISAEHVLDRAAALGRDILEMTAAAVHDGCDALVKDVRGVGLLIGIEMAGDDMAGELVMELMERRVLVSHSLNAQSVVRLTPPAVMDRSDLDWLRDALVQSGRALAERFC